jgi:hypothetical protein
MRTDSHVTSTSHIAGCVVDYFKRIGIDLHKRVKVVMQYCGRVYFGADIGYECEYWIGWPDNDSALEYWFLCSRITNFQFSSTGIV